MMKYVDHRINPLLRRYRLNVCIEPQEVTSEIVLHALSELNNWSNKFFGYAPIIRQIIIIYLQKIAET
jgi:hypothetical protein